MISIYVDRQLEEFQVSIENKRFFCVPFARNSSKYTLVPDIPDNMYSSWKNLGNEIAKRIDENTFRLWRENSEVQMADSENEWAHVGGRDNKYYPVFLNGFYGEDHEVLIIENGKLVRGDDNHA